MVGRAYLGTMAALGLLYYAVGAAAWDGRRRARGPGHGRHRGRHRSRRPQRAGGWLLLAGATALLGTGNVLLTVAGGAAPGRFPSPADGFDPGRPTCRWRSGCSGWAGPGSPPGTGRMLLDTLALSLAGSVVVWIALVRPAVAEPAPGGLGEVGRGGERGRLRGGPGRRRPGRAGLADQHRLRAARPRRRRFLFVELPVRVRAGPHNGICRRPGSGWARSPSAALCRGGRADAVMAGIGPRPTWAGTASGPGRLALHGGRAADRAERPAGRGDLRAGHHRGGDRGGIGGGGRAGCWPGWPGRPAHCGGGRPGSGPCVASSRALMVADTAGDVQAGLDTAVATMVGPRRRAGARLVGPGRLRPITDGKQPPGRAAVAGDRGRPGRGRQLAQPGTASWSGRWTGRGPRQPAAPGRRAGSVRRRAVVLHWPARPSWSELAPMLEAAGRPGRAGPGPDRPGQAAARPGARALLPVVGTDQPGRDADLPGRADRLRHPVGAASVPVRRAGPALRLGGTAQDPGRRPPHRTVRTAVQPRSRPRGRPLRTVPKGWSNSRAGRP